MKVSTSAGEGLYFSNAILIDEDGQHYRQIGEYRIYENPNAAAEEPIYEDPGWPILTDWGDEIYVSDTTIAQYRDPRIAISDSLLHVFSQGALHPHHYVSYNNGDSWQFFADYNDTSFNVGPGIINIFCEDSRVFTVWMGRRGNENTFIYYRASDDYGQTWNITAELVERPWHWMPARYGNVAGHGDTVFVSFEEDSVTCWRSTDMGVSWSSPGYISSRQGSGYPPSIAYNAGIVSLAYNQAYQSQLDVLYIRSSDHGITWSDPVLLGFDDGNQGQWPEVAADSFGNVAVSWMDYQGSPYGWTGGIWVRISHDSGQTWDYPVRMETDYRGDVATHVVIDGSYVGVVWKSVRTDEYNGLHYRESRDGGVTWSLDQHLSSGPSYVPRLAKKDDNVHLAWKKTERIPPDNEWWVFIKYLRNDDLMDIDLGSEGLIMPGDYSLSSYPNPFNSSVVLTIAGFKGGDVEIRVFDVTGALLKTLKTKEGKATWDATDNSGRKAASGIYFARARTSDNFTTIKLLYLK